MEFSYIHTYIHGLGAAVGHEVYLIRKKKKKRQKKKEKKPHPSNPLPTCIVHEIKNGFILQLKLGGDSLCKSTSPLYDFSTKGGLISPF